MATLAQLASCQKRLTQVAQQPNHPIIKETKQQLTEYFLGKKQVFTVPIKLNGTPFQFKYLAGISKDTLCSGIKLWGAS